jgi:hypothetical protein
MSKKICLISVAHSSAGPENQTKPKNTHSGRNNKWRSRTNIKVSARNESMLRKSVLANILREMCRHYLIRFYK